MSDEQQAETTEKRGRPKGSRDKPKPPPVRRDPVHRGAHHRADDDGQDPLDGFEYRPYTQDNPLSIDPDIVRGIERDWGYSLLWVCYENCGKPTPNLVSARQKNGYAPVTKGNFGGALDFMCDKHDGGIRHEGLMLMARPTQIQRMAEAHDKRAAKAAVDHMKASHQVEGLNVSMPGGGDHPSALRQNRHRSTFEPGPKIPS
jgi:hypothetical protein